VLGRKGEKNYKNSHLIPVEAECAEGSVTSSGMCHRWFSLGLL